MRTHLQSLEETFLRGGREELGRRRQFRQQLLQDIKVELGIHVVQKEQRSFVVPTAKELDFRELQKEHNHLLLPSRQHLRGGSAGCEKLDGIALRTGK